MCVYFFANVIVDGVLLFLLYFMLLFVQSQTLSVLLSDKITESLKNKSFLQQFVYIFVSRIIFRC